MSSTFDRPSFDRSTPPSQMAISQIPALTAHISFLTLRAHIRQNRLLANLPSLSNGNLTHSCSECSYSFPTLRDQHLADQVLADLSHPSNGSFTDSCSTLRVHIWQTKCWEIYPSFKWQFYRILLLLLIFLSYSMSSTFGRPGLDISTPPSNGNFTDSCSDCWEFIPTLSRLNMWQTRSWQVHPPINR